MQLCIKFNYCNLCGSGYWMAHIGCLEYLLIHTHAHTHQSLRSICTLLKCYYKNTNCKHKRSRSHAHSSLLQFWWHHIASRQRYDLRCVAIGNKREDCDCKRISEMNKRKKVGPDDSVIARHAIARLAYMRGDFVHCRCVLAYRFRFGHMRRFAKEEIQINCRIECNQTSGDNSLREYSPRFSLPFNWITASFFLHWTLCNVQVWCDQTDCRWWWS